MEPLGVGWTSQGSLSPPVVASSGIIAVILPFQNLQACAAGKAKQKQNMSNAWRTKELNVRSDTNWACLHKTWNSNQQRYSHSKTGVTAATANFIAALKYDNHRPCTPQTRKVHLPCHPSGASIGLMFKTEPKQNTIHPSYQPSRRWTDNIHFIKIHIIISS